MWKVEKMTHKIIHNNLTNSTTIINEDSFIHEEVLDIFAEEQEKINRVARRNRCDFYSIQEQENGVDYDR